MRLYGIDDGRGGKAKQLQQIADAAAQRSDDESPSSPPCAKRRGVLSALWVRPHACGPTHGGQIVVPGVLNGLFARAGILSQNGGGRYDFGNQTLIISRGLARKPFGCRASAIRRADEVTSSPGPANKTENDAPLAARDCFVCRITRVLNHDFDGFANLIAQLIRRRISDRQNEADARALRQVEQFLDLALVVPADDTGGEPLPVAS